jgi:hypothetical protein
MRWLDDFDPRIQTRGRNHHFQGRVSELSLRTNPVDPTYAEVSGAVGGNHVYDCELVHDADLGWDGRCNCPAGYKCEHQYATGLALIDNLGKSTFRPVASPSNGAPARPPPPSVPPDEQALVAAFAARTGAPPDRKALAYLRNILAVHRSLRSNRYIDVQALDNLIPRASFHLFYSHYGNPFADRWSRTPDTALEFWSHFALLLKEKGVPTPGFMEPLTDLEAARRAVAAHHRERELSAWRARFAELEATVPPAVEAPPAPLQSLRLRLARKKPLWEISVPAPATAEPPAGSANPGADPAAGPPATGPLPRFEALSATQLRDLVEAAERAAFTLDPASAAFASILRARQYSTGRSTLKLSNQDDRTFLGRLLLHPLVRTCVVDEGGRPITRDPRRLVWQFRDHPTDPELADAHLTFADGTPAPAPLIHLPGKTSLYLHAATVFAGLPPLSSVGADAFDPTVPVPIPRAALALPEAGRFAARVGLALPNDTAGRFRPESLRPRLRAEICPRRPGSADEVLLVELAALAPDGTPRAVYDAGNWRRTGPGLPPPPPDSAFLVLDFEPTRAAVAQFQQLPTYLDAGHPEGERLHAVLGANFPETFPVWLGGFPPHTLIELAPDLAAFAQAPTRAHLALDLSAGDEAGGIDWFDVRVTLRAEDTTLTPEEIALLHGARGRFVRLAGRGWRRLALDDSPGTREKLARLGLDPATAAAETGREPLRFHALQLADEALRDALPEKLWAQVRERSAALRSPAPPPAPAGLVADLRPYQHEGFHFLAFLAGNRFGGVLADDMGLGKTLQTLAWLLWLHDHPARDRGKKGGGKPFRVLVVCPKSVVVNWQLETARFAPGLTAAPLTPRDDAGLLPAGAHLVVANYTQLRLHADALAAETWDAVVLDEGQNIKNPASATAQAARALRTNHRLVLTGTPVENRLLDLWSLFAFAQPGLLGGQTAFKRLYNDKTDPVGSRDRLAQRVKHFLLRRTKSQVARDLPPRIEKDLEVDLEGTQRTLYDAELKRTRQLLLGVKSAREFDTQRFNILQSLLRLRQICCDPRLVATPATGTRPKKAEDEPPPSAKLEALLDTLEPLVAEGHKVLVFSQFVTMLELIRAELNTRGLAHLLLTGQTENRQALVDQFQSDPAIPVFLLSLKAAGSGLNLTAASYVVLFDPWWNPAVEAQAIDRTHRIGQKNQVMAYRLIARNTVEEKIRALQKEKAALAAAVVQEESLASVLDLDSLRRILA